LKDKQGFMARIIAGLFLKRKFYKDSYLEATKNKSLVEDEMRKRGINYK